jgi:hypothetical protein
MSQDQSNELITSIDGIVPLTCLLADTSFRPKELSKISNKDNDCIAVPGISLSNVFKENVAPKRTNKTDSVPFLSPESLMNGRSFSTNRSKFMTGSFQVESNLKSDDRKSKNCGQRISRLSKMVDFSIQR